MAETEVVYMFLEYFVLLDSVRYHDDVMAVLKSDYYNLKALILGYYCQLTSSCVPFTIYRQCHGNIKGDVTPTVLQYQNVPRLFITSLKREDD